MNKLRKSAYITALKQMELKENEIPKLDDESVLLKVYSCAVCGSDVRIFNHGNNRVNFPQIMGHEIAGEIVDVGKNVKDFSKGDRVSLGADVPCGQCEHCKNDRGNCCDINYAIGYQFEGGFTEYMVLNETVVKYGPLNKLPDDLDYDSATLTEPLGCCINGYERGFMDSRPNSDIVIFGAGPIGVLLALLAPVYKAKSVTMIDPNQERLNRAKNEFGVDYILNPNEVDVVEEVMKITNNKGADMIFTACTVADTHEQGIKMLAKRGVINLFGGLPKGTRNISLDSNEIHYKEAYITGSHGSTPTQNKKALDLISQKKVDIKGIITHKYPLDNILEAFDMAASGDAIKVIINPNKEQNNV